MTGPGRARQRATTNPSPAAYWSDGLPRTRRRLELAGAKLAAPGWLRHLGRLGRDIGLPEAELGTGAACIIDPDGGGPRFW